MSLSTEGDNPMTSGGPVDAVSGLGPVERLAELVRLGEAATPGQWRWTYPGSGCPVLMGTVGDERYSWDSEVIEAVHDGGCACRKSCWLELHVKAADAEFIAAARNSWGWLVKLAGRADTAEREIERLEPVERPAELVRLREAVRNDPAGGSGFMDYAGALFDAGPWLAEMAGRADTAEAERDALRAALDRVLALADEWRSGHEVSEWNPLDELDAAIKGRS